MLSLILIAALLSAGGGAANALVILANEKMDMLIAGVTAALKTSNLHMVSVLDKKVSISKKVLLVTITGSASINGQLGDLSTLRRAGDASLSMSGTVLTLQGIFGANVGGSLQASVSWNGIGVLASVSVTLCNFQAFLKATHNLGDSGARPELREVRIHSLGSLSVSIGGLGVLDWALGSISGAMPGIISEVLNGWVGNQLASALRHAVRLLRLG